MKIKINSQTELAKAFEKYGRPVKIYSKIGTYISYETESLNDIFDGAINLLYYTKLIVLIF